MAWSDKVSIKLAQKALAQYLPSTRTEIVKISSPRLTEALRVWFESETAQDYFIGRGTWHQIYAESAFEVPAFDLHVSAGSGQQLISAVIAADIGRWFRPHVFPIPTDYLSSEAVQGADERLYESMNFLEALAQRRIPFTDNADLLAATLLDQITEQIEESRAESSEPSTKQSELEGATNAEAKSPDDPASFGNVASKAADILRAAHLDVGVRWGAPASATLPAERVLVEVWGVENFVVLVRDDKMFSCGGLDLDAPLDEQIDLEIQYRGDARLLAMAVADQIVSSWVLELEGVPFSTFGDHRTAEYTFFRPIAHLLDDLARDSDGYVSERADSLNAAHAQKISAQRPPSLGGKAPLW